MVENKIQHEISQARKSDMNNWYTLEFFRYHQIMSGKLPSKKGHGGTGGQLAKYEAAVCPGDKEGQCHPGLCQE